MLAPPPVIVHVPDETVVLPSIPVLPISRLAQPVGSADCARTKLALTTQRAYECHSGQSSAPNLSCRQSASPGDLSRAFIHSARHVSCRRTDVSPSNSTTLIC